MTSDAADEIFSILKRLGCHTVHIGGGEPLLQPEKLIPVLESAVRHNVGIDYIETNASWYKDEQSAISVLKEMMKHKVHTLLISIDPFHNEYIPFYKVKGLMKACSKVNMGVFPWLMEFWNELACFDDRKPHSLDEYEKHFGRNYIITLPSRYGLNLRGRALKTFRPMMRTDSYERIIERSAPCRLLSGIHHFHVDLYGNFIPQSCSGLSIKFSELYKGADPDKYPVFYRLETIGIKGLAELAVKEYGYKPKAEYAGQCDLCHDIRTYFALKVRRDFPDLQPVDFYRFV